MRRSPFFIVAVTLALTLSTLAYWPTRGASAADGGANPAPARLRPGTDCKVYFRGDAAGQSVQSYVATVNNNASVSGSIVSVDDQWLVVARDKRETHIPRAVVLMIEVAKP